MGEEGADVDVRLELASFACTARDGRCHEDLVDVYL